VESAHVFHDTTCSEIVIRFQPQLIEHCLERTAHSMSTVPCCIIVQSVFWMQC